MSGSGDHTVRLWDAQTGALLQEMIGHCNDVRSVVYSPDGLLIASGSSDHTVRIWDAASGLQVGVYTGHLDEVANVIFSADSRRVASGDDEDHVHVWWTEAPHRSIKEFRV